MKRIGNYIKYFPATDEPLSADVYFIDGERYCYIFDVGSNENSLQIIQNEPKEKVIILSHWHKDHTGNIGELDYSELYVGNLTKQKLGIGTVVRNTVSIHDGIDMEILPCVSPHSKGCLIVNVNHEYTLIADLFFSRPPINTEAAKQMIRKLESIETGFFVVSHSGDENIYEKQDFIKQLHEHFGV